ncbi:hypothetical protein HOLleu_38369 [Holothuria leucospilota]|uniref:Uncharacterized protein n=1 Tax=Holothuria leucospilota TaxID=206669 RepID=A0A9Q1BC48_HOLLE|nr:hypothetical protein HOLleu_38369 [Holothuria leucospilota]
MMWKVESTLLPLNIFQKFLPSAPPKPLSVKKHSENALASPSHLCYTTISSKNIPKIAPFCI